MSAPGAPRRGLFARRSIGIDAYLAATQLGITLASIGLGAVGEPVFEELLRPLLGEAAVFGGVGLASALAFGLITLLHVVGRGDGAAWARRMDRGRRPSSKWMPRRSAPVRLVQAPADRKCDRAAGPPVEGGGDR